MLNEMYMKCGMWQYTSEVMRTSPTTLILLVMGQTWLTLQVPHKLLMPIKVLWQELDWNKCNKRWICSLMIAIILLVRIVYYLMGIHCLFSGLNHMSHGRTRMSWTCVVTLLSITAWLCIWWGHSATMDTTTSSTSPTTFSTILHQSNDLLDQSCRPVLVCSSTSQASPLTTWEPDKPRLL
jgi:hypothetical protein